MQKIFILLFMIFISCKSNISTSQKELILSELDYIYKIDQKYARIPSQEQLDKYGYQKAWENFGKKRDSIQLENQDKIKKIYSKFGYLGFNKIGKENSTKFWITIQHADNDVCFQKKMLKALKKEVNKDNASKKEYALLEDRVAINSNQKQRFGTQVEYNNQGQAVPKNGLVDSLNIAKLRTEYELPEFKEYYNSMTLSHFEMNKEFLIKKGITKPTLYK